MQQIVRKLLLGLLALPAANAFADPEIMVHENDVAAPGKVTATLHFNRVVRGDETSSDGTWPAHRLTNAMAEFALGVVPGWEAGIHLPVMRAGVDSESSRQGRWGASAVMFRIKHVRQGDGGFFYGFNAEYDINAGRYVAADRGVELRAIAGVDGERFRITINPHLMWGWGSQLADHRPDYNVDAKVLHKAAAGFAWGVEAYSDWGKANQLHPGRGDRMLYLVAEWESALGALHLGVGRGFKETPERDLIKLVWSTFF